MADKDSSVPTGSTSSAVSTNSAIKHPNTQGPQGASSLKPFQQPLASQVLQQFNNQHPNPPRCFTIQALQQPLPSQDLQQLNIQAPKAPRCFTIQALQQPFSSQDLQQLNIPTPKAPRCLITKALPTASCLSKPSTIGFTS
ncbi:unnamed protein product [Closterium sp. Naga37s-1]|nr:unnamed protein product [Closterium sp. Naga37s-1]